MKIDTYTVEMRMEEELVTFEGIRDGEVVVTTTISMLKEDGNLNTEEAEKLGHKYSNMIRL